MAGRIISVVICRIYLVFNNQGIEEHTIKKQVNFHMELNPKKINLKHDNLPLWNITLEKRRCPK